MIAAAHTSAPNDGGPGFEQPMLTIGQRPFPPEDRSQPGHWEGDLIIGKDQGSAIGTLVERQTADGPAAAPAAPGRRRDCIAP